MSRRRLQGACGSRLVIFVDTAGILSDRRELLLGGVRCFRDSVEDVLFLPSRVFKYAALKPVQSLLLLLEEAEILDHLQGELQVCQEARKGYQVIILYKVLDAPNPLLESLNVIAHLLTTLELIIEEQKLVQMISRLPGCKRLLSIRVALIKAFANGFDPLALQGRILLLFPAAFVFGVFLLLLFFLVPD